MRSTNLWLVVPFALQATALVSPVHRRGIWDTTITDGVHNDHSDCQVLGGDVANVGNSFSHNHDPTNHLAHCGEPARDTSVSSEPPVSSQSSNVASDSGTNLPANPESDASVDDRAGCTINDRWFADPLGVLSQLNLGLVEPPTGMASSVFSNLLQICVKSSDNMNSLAGHTGISTGPSGLDIAGPGNLALGTDAAGMSGILAPVNGLLGGVDTTPILGGLTIGGSGVGNSGGPVQVGGSNTPSGTGAGNLLGGLDIVNPGQGNLVGAADGVLGNVGSNKPVALGNNVGTSPPNFEHSSQGSPDDLDVGVADSTGRTAHGNVTPTSSRGPLGVLDSILSHFKTNTNTGLTNNGVESPQLTEGDDTGKHCVTCGIPS